jgi:hypothetical protein
MADREQRERGGKGTRDKIPLRIYLLQLGPTS